MGIINVVFFLIIFIWFSGISGSIRDYKVKKEILQVFKKFKTSITTILSSSTIVLKKKNILYQALNALNFHRYLPTFGAE